MFIERPVLSGRLQELKRANRAGSAIGPIIEYAGQSGVGAAQLHAGELVGQCKARKPADRRPASQIANTDDGQPARQGADERCGQKVRPDQRSGSERLQPVGQEQSGAERSEQVLANGGDSKLSQGDDIECWRIFQCLQIQARIVQVETPQKMTNGSGGV